MVQCSLHQEGRMLQAQILGKGPSIAGELPISLLHQTMLLKLVPTESGPWLITCLCVYTG